MKADATAVNWPRIVLICIGLMVSTAFLLAIFWNNPYPSVPADPDSVYIFSSLSKLTGNTVRHNAHPGLTLQIAGALPIVLGAIFCREEGLIQKVIANMPFFQQLFVGLVASSLIVALVVFLWTSYQKDRPIHTVIIALIGIAALTPPSLGKVMGVNSDFYAFSLSILYVTSLLWKRNWKNDVLTSLFFVLMAYTKITFAPLCLLMFTMDKKCLHRLLKGTFVWSLLIFLVFWELDQFYGFRSFMLHSSMLNKPGSLTLSTVLKFHTKFFLENKVQSIYILLFLLFGILLILKNKFRTTGILGLIIIITIVETTLLRQGKAVIYTWSAFPVGMLLTLTLLRAYPRVAALIVPVFIILFIASTMIIHEDVTDARKRGMQRLKYQQEYKRILTEASARCLLEYHGRQPYHHLSIGSSYWLANAFSRREYAPYLKKYFNDRFGLRDLFYMQQHKDGRPAIRRYFEKGESESLQWIPSEGGCLSIESNLESEFKTMFPQVELVPVCSLKNSGIKILKIQKANEPFL